MIFYNDYGTKYIKVCTFNYKGTNYHGYICLTCQSNIDLYMRSTLIGKERDDARLLFCKKSNGIFQFGHILPVLEGKIYFRDNIIKEREIDKSFFTEVTERNTNVINALRQRTYNKIDWNGLNFSTYSGLDIRPIYYDNRGFDISGIAPVYNKRTNSLLFNPILFYKLEGQDARNIIKRIFAIENYRHIFGLMERLKDSEFKRIIQYHLDIDNFI